MPPPDRPAAAPGDAQPWVTVVLLNYNCTAWLPRCLESLAAQTIFSRCEILIADNQSTDGSDVLAQKLIADWPNGLFVQNGCNPGFGAGSNLAVKRASGRYLFFLNPDVWLEPDCLEQLVAGAKQAGVGVASPLVLEYEDNSVQGTGGTGFDLCGSSVGQVAGDQPTRLFTAHGFTFMRRDLFERLGGYDDTFFLYGEEFDLSWRAWVIGEEIMHVPAARIHHRGAAAVNPQGGTRIVEMRTSESKRFYANRNNLITLLKNSQHLLLLLVLPNVAQLLVEASVGAILLRRWSFFSRTGWGALAGCWRARGHILAQRRRLRALRRRGDFGLLRFLRFRLNRMTDYGRILQKGLPKVDPR